VAPISVFLDPVRARVIFGLDEGACFSFNVLYIYLKQIEEADLLVITKSDLLNETKIDSLRAAILEKFPTKEIITISSRTGTNLESWFGRITRRKQSASEAIQVDYDIYADGEARLGWLNSTVELTAGAPFDVDEFLMCLANEIQARMQQQKTEVAHLKMTVSSGADGNLAAIQLVGSNVTPELSVRGNKLVRNATLSINLRAESKSEVLAAAIRQSLVVTEAQFSLHATTTHLEHFQPGKPSPTYRDGQMTS
jgi:G3E family GTPase